MAYSLGDNQESPAGAYSEALRGGPTPFGVELRGVFDDADPSSVIALVGFGLLVAGMRPSCFVAAQVVDCSAKKVQLRMALCARLLTEGGNDATLLAVMSISYHIIAGKHGYE